MASTDPLMSPRAETDERAAHTDPTEVVDDLGDATVVESEPDKVRPEPGSNGRRIGRLGAADRSRSPLFEPARRPGRRVTRVVRRVQLWSVFKVAIFGALIAYAIFLISVALGWSLANSTGQVHHIEKFMRDIGFDNWSFDGSKLFKASLFLGAVGVVAGSILVTLAAAIMNVISELTGGIRFTVLEVDVDDDDEEVDVDRA